MKDKLNKYILSAKNAENPQGFFSDNELANIMENGYKSGLIKNPRFKFRIFTKRNIIMTTICTSISIFLLAILMPFNNENDLDNHNPKNGLALNDNYNYRTAYDTDADEMDISSFSPTAATENQNTIPSEPDTDKKSIQIKTNTLNIDNKFRLVIGSNQSKQNNDQDKFYSVAINPESGIKWDSIYVNTGTNTLQGSYSKKKDIHLGAVTIPEDEFQKIIDAVYEEIKGFYPPSIDLLQYEKNHKTFDSMIQHSIELCKGKMSGSDDLQNMIAKINLYDYLAKKLAENISGIEVLEMNDSELEILGISKKDGKYKVDIEESYQLIINDLKKDNNPQYLIDKYMEKIYKRNIESGYPDPRNKSYYRLTIHLGIGFTYEDTKYTGWDQNKFMPVQPVAISVHGYNENNDGTKNNVSPIALLIFDNSSFYNISDDDMDSFDWASNSFDGSMTNLVPLKLTVSDTIKNKLRYVEYTLWYPPTEEFINALPESYKAPLAKQFNLLQEVENGEIPVEEACEAIKGEPRYFDVCRMETATISGLKLFPNPLSGNELNMTFNLAEEAFLTFKVHEINGKYVNTIKSNIAVEKGPQTILLELDKDLAPGIYLISITTDKGDMVVKRLIKQ